MIVVTDFPHLYLPASDLVSGWVILAPFSYGINNACVIALTLMVNIFNVCITLYLWPCDAFIS